MEMELERLYRYLKEKPRDARWMLRKVGASYLETVEEMRRRGWTVECRLEDVNGLHRAVYCADLQGELFLEKDSARPAPRRRRARAGRALEKLRP
jgi:hypothetical protein